MKTIYILKLENKKNMNYLLKYHLNFIKIEYKDDSCFLYVNEKDYFKISKYFNVYNISLYKVEGLLKYKKLISQYYIFIISIILGLFFLYLLTFIIFDIKIMTNKVDLVRIIEDEFDAVNLKRYRFVKSFDEKERIKKNLLANYKDKFEWIEIDRIGTKYYVHLLERVIHDKNNQPIYQNIIARKNAVIMEIKANNGDVVRKINDYVNKGDVIISGKIMKNDEVKNIVEAEGEIYGETWYNVKVELPKTYVTKIYTGNSFSKLSFNIFDKRLFFFKKKKYLNEEYIDYAIISNSLIPFSLNKTIIKEVQEDTYFYTYQDALDLGLSLAKNKLVSTLREDSKILYQKNLKLYEENSTIIVEVFFKVYENITDYQKIEVGE